MKRGKLVLICGPTGSGKGTLMRHALARLPMISSPHSYTTRARRAEAVENVHYTFISPEEFKAKIEGGEFLEWALFSGNYYGTLRADIEQGLAEGKVMFKEMEVQGIRQMQKTLPRSEYVTVFVDAGSWEESRARALARGPMDEETLEKRHCHYLSEMEFMPEADVIIHNLAGQYEQAEAAFEAVLREAVDESEAA
jgi:guanylate kinase